MSLALTEGELKRFLESAEPQVFCLSGKWGVGKTYTWKKVLGDKSAPRSDKFPYYSYVSLFGVETLDRLRTSVFENAVSLKPASQGGDKGAGKFIKENWRRHVKRVQELPVLKDYVPNVEPYLFNFVKEYVVCFDDLERMSASLQISDVLGLVSYLKEQRDCKVLIVLNTDALKDRTSDFETYFEKVVDVNLVFAPTPQESVDAALPAPTGALVKLKEQVIRLGITNIRVIKRIERFVEMLEQVLAGNEDAALSQAVHSAALLGWVLYEPRVAPSLEFIKTRRQRAYGDKAKELTAEELLWDKRLADYGFGEVDDFDQLILDGLRVGYFDDAQIASLADKIDKRVEKEHLREQFNQAWDDYLSSMGPVREGFADDLFAAASAASEFITAMELDGTMSVLRSYGRPDLATALLDRYVNQTARSPEFYSLQGYFGQYVTDAELRAAFAEKHVTLEDARPLFDVLRKMVENSGWSPNDVSRLLNFSEDQYYDALSSYHGRDLNPMVQFALDFRAREDGKPIGERMEAALRRLAGEGAVQARRAGLFGIEPEQQPAVDGGAAAH